MSMNKAMKAFRMISVAIAIGLATHGFDAFASVGELSIDNVSFVPSKIENGIVDIECTVSCDDPTAEISILFSARDDHNGRILPVCHIWRDGDESRTNALVVTRGTHRFVWDAGKDAFDLLSSNIVLDVQAFVGVHPYLVVDLSGGPDAASYPVSHLDAMPLGGWTDEYKTDKLVLRALPPGHFMMGSPTNELGRLVTVMGTLSSESEMLRGVTLTRPFYIGVFELTQRQYELVSGVNPMSDGNTNAPTYYRVNDKYPVTCSYDDFRGDAAVYNWPGSLGIDPNSWVGRLRSRTGGMPFDLPTEAQWEYACRAGTTTALNSGRNLTSTNSCPNMAEVGRYSQNRKDGRPGEWAFAFVGLYMPNTWGLFDMHGNACEWCLDTIHSYSESGFVDPTSRPGVVGNRIVRGGGWSTLLAAALRSASRTNRASNSSEPAPRLSCAINGGLACRATVSGPIDLRKIRVDDVSFRQRYPWNGLVDIDFTLSSIYDPTNLFDILVSAKDCMTGKSLAVKSLWLESDTSVSNEIVLAHGRHRLVWNAAADNPGFSSTNVSIGISAQIGGGMGEYLVIDLSGGTNALGCAISSLDAPPSEGWTDEFKTKYLVMRRIPAGTFMMGSPSDEFGYRGETLHRVTLTKPFYMGVFEVTQEQYCQVTGNRPTKYSGSGMTLPANNIFGENNSDSEPIFDWPPPRGFRPDSFIGRLCVNTGISSFNFPTEAEWEYACRAGTSTALNSGKNIESVSNDVNMAEVGRYLGNVGDGRSYNNTRAAPVGSYLPNNWGLYDMHGNVSEWVLDWYGRYPSADAVDPTGPTTGTMRTLRGGSCYNNADMCRSASRMLWTTNSTHVIGIRLKCSGSLVDGTSCDGRSAVGRGISAAGRLDLRTGTHFVTEGDAISIAYSPRWGEAASCTLDLGGARSVATEEDTAIWVPQGIGAHTLTHIAGDLTYTAQFAVLGDDVVVHGGLILANETWESNKVHLVTSPITLGDNDFANHYELEIQAGAVVKFMSGTGISIASNANCRASGAIFTHVNDDSVGGDTLGDGDSAPSMDAYEVPLSLLWDETAEFRYHALPTVTLSGNISKNETWRGHNVYRVTGNLTVRSGVTLTILPGAVVKFNSGVSLTVSSGATLNAIGTRAAPIVFTSIKDDAHGGDTNGDGEKTRPDGGDWRYIYVSGTANMKYCKVLYGAPSNETGILETTGSGVLNMDCCYVAHALYDGIWNWGGSISVKNTIITDTGWATAPYRGSKNEYINCIFYQNNVGMCYWSNWNGNPIYKNCVFTECGNGWCELGSGSYGDPPSRFTTANCLFWNPAEFGTQSCGIVGSNGNIWGDPKFVDAENGDFRIAADSPCVDVADASTAPEKDCFGQPRVNAPDIGICEVIPRGTTSDIDLVPQSVTADADAVPGQEITIRWKVQNAGGASVDAAWRDTVSLVSESGRTVQLGDYMNEKHLAVGGTVICSASFVVPAISEGTWYPKVNVNSYRDVFEGALGDNNALTGETAIDVSIDAMDLSVVNDGVINAGMPTVLKLVFDENNSNRMVKFDVPAGVTATWGFGFMPGGSRSVATASGFMTATSDGAMFRVPDGATDVYVVLESDTTTTYNLSTESTKMTITSVTPATLPSSGTTTLTIRGAGFGETNALSLISSVGRVALNAPQKDTSGNLIATIDCATLTAGQTYAVRVESGENAAELPGAVSVVKAEGTGILELEYDVPSSVRPGRVFTFTVTYRNTGNKDMCVPLLTVQDTGTDAQNPIQFSLDGERFTSGGFQFVGNDAEGGFGPLHPGDEVTLLLMAKIPPANNGSTAVSVRANTESDIMAKYTTEIDRYLTPAMKAEFAATTDAELKARGERMAQVFGANNGEMVQNFAALAKRFVECNGFALQKVDELVAYGEAEKKNVVNQKSTRDSLALSSSIWDGYGNAFDLDEDTGVWVLQGFGGEKHRITADDDLSNKRVAIIAHGLDNSVHNDWVTSMAFALKESGRFDVVLGVNWEKEADWNWKPNTWLPIAESIYIDDVGVKVGLELARAKINPSKTTLIGHSFGSHLLGYVAAECFRGHVFERHIGLDTAETKQTPDGYEVKGGCALRTEFYRTSSGSGRNGAYAHENYIVCPKDGFDIVGFLDPHSYAHTWFIKNIGSKIAKDNKVGFWSERPPLIGGNGFLGVINGDDQKLECVYRYGQSGFNYPGNKSGWLEMRDAWKHAVDLDITNNGSVSLRDNAELQKGVTQHITVRVSDNCDIQTVDRMRYLYRLGVYFVGDGSSNENMVYFNEQFGDVFDFDLVISDMTVPFEGKGTLIFRITNGFTGGGNLLDQFKSYADRELYASDNAKEIPVTIIKTDLPVACINGESQDGFVIRHEIPYKSYEVYEEAVKSGKTFDFKFDGTKSIGGGDKKITGYRWRLTKDDTAALGEKSTLTRQYSATLAACYPICLTVGNNVGETSTVNGMLEVVPVWKDNGQPIEQPRSYDPNEMRGKLGLGDPETQRFVKPGEELTYTIYFENKTNATAAAQEVYVTNPLSEWLDWSTFKMHEVAFGDQIDLGLADKSSGTSEVTMKGTNFVVRTELVLEENGDAGKRDACPYQARWYMRIVDPTTETGWPTDIVAGFLPPNDETHRGEGHITYSICVREDAPANLVISNSADIVFDHNPSIKTDPAWWNTVSPIDEFLQAGEYFKAMLAELGYDVPTDGKTPYTVKALGLPAGLKLVGNKAVKDKKGKITKKANVEWWIEGVPTAPLDFMTNPPYLVITVNGETRTETLPVDVKAQEVVDLGELELGQSINTNGWLAGVGAGWTVSGLPTGLKYATKKVTKTTGSGKKKVTTTVAEAYAVYGKTTKAGLFTITAKKKAGAFYETKKYRVLVTPKAPDTGLFGESITNITTMAYVPLNWNLETGEAVPSVPSVPFVPSSADGGKVTKVAGLPTGLTFAASTTYKDKKKTQVKQLGQTIAGTPTKPGTYVVTFTKNVTTGTGKNKKTVAKTAQILWTVTANDANLELGFNTAGGVIEGGTVGLKYGDLMAFSATDGATVTASGLPKGITLANLGDGQYAFKGFTAKAGTYLVTVTATLNGKTVTQRVALKVDGLPDWAKGSFNGTVIYSKDIFAGLATMSVTAAGKISGKFQEFGTNWTFSASSYTNYNETESMYSATVTAKYAYKVKEKVKGKWKNVTKYLTREFTFDIAEDRGGGFGGVVLMSDCNDEAYIRINAYQNLWGRSDYKELGKRIFWTSKKKPYKEFSDFVDVEGTSCPISLKITSSGVVTATLTFDTGKTKKNKKTKKMEPVYYKPSCTTVVIQQTAADADPFRGEINLYFAPSPANNFPGCAPWMSKEF